MQRVNSHFKTYEIQLFFSYKPGTFRRKSLHPVELQFVFKMLKKKLRKKSSPTTHFITIEMKYIKLLPGGNKRNRYFFYCTLWTRIFFSSAFWKKPRKELWKWYLRQIWQGRSAKTSKNSLLKVKLDSEQYTKQQYTVY